MHAVYIPLYYILLFPYVILASTKVSSYATLIKPVKRPFNIVGIFLVLPNIYIYSR